MRELLYAVRRLRGSPMFTREYDGRTLVDARALSADVMSRYREWHPVISVTNRDLGSGG